jgi:hypothetical protein
MSSTRESCVFPEASLRRPENIFHPDLEMVRSSFFIEFSSGDKFAQDVRGMCFRRYRRYANDD